MGAGTSSGKTTTTGASLQGRSFNTRGQLESALKQQGYRIVDKETDMNSPGVSYSGAYWIARNDNPDEDYMVDVRVGNNSVTIERIRRA